MKSCSIIIQGEGKGHFSQALAFYDMLMEEELDVRRIFVSRSIGKSLPEYFEASFPGKITKFYSPNFLLSSSGKGIKITLSIILNVFLSPLYIYEIFRVGIGLRFHGGEKVYNFYDVVGGMAAKIWKLRKNVVTISHHFYLSHPDFLHPNGFERQYFWLQFMNRFFIRNSGKIKALSFRRGSVSGKIEVVPPLIDKRVLEMSYESGDRDLCYFLKPGFLEEAITFYRSHPEDYADIFTDVGIENIPENVVLHATSRVAFLSCMQHCRRIITTGGFDTIAEAFYLGIPIFCIPSENHYEQYCNSIDASRTGMAFQLEEIADVHDAGFDPKGNKAYRKWAMVKPSYR